MTTTDNGKVEVGQLPSRIPRDDFLMFEDQLQDILIGVLMQSRGGIAPKRIYKYVYSLCWDCLLDTIRELDVKPDDEGESN